MAEPQRQIEVTENNQAVAQRFEQEQQRNETFHDGSVISVFFLSSLSSLSCLRLRPQAGLVIGTSVISVVSFVGSNFGTACGPKTRKIWSP